MSTNTELIARLRETASKGVSAWGDLQMEAAKELEIVTAEREAYASAMDRMKAESSDFATIAGLEASVSRLSSIVDEQLRLLIDVEKECGTDGYGGEFEDGESVIIDRVRAHIACYAAPILQQVAEPAPSSLPLLSEAFRTTESNGASSDYRMVFKFKDLASLHSADDEWRKFKGAA